MAVIERWTLHDTRHPRGMMRIEGPRVERSVTVVRESDYLALASQLAGAVDREREILRELRISGADLDGERLAAWIERRWPDFGGQS